MRRVPAAVVALLAAVVAVHLAVTGRGGGATPIGRLPDVPTVPMPTGAFTATVVRVVDGDTFLARVDGRGPVLRVRVIGADTPETVKPGVPVRCFGPQASALTKRLLPVGSVVHAAHEPGGDTDRYGRQLWDVWLGDGRLLQSLLVASGAARAYPFAPQLEHADELAALQRTAQAGRRGLWGPPCDGHSF
jgi:micrococcal nuclease